MSGYFKRVLILKNLTAKSVRCLVKVECDKNLSRVAAEVFYGSKSYLLFLSLGGIVKVIKIGKNARIAEDFEALTEIKGASALLVEEEGLYPVSFAADGEEYLSYEELLSAAENHEDFEDRNYDDELIATDNYYEGEISETERIYSGAAIENGEAEREEKEEEGGSQPLFYEACDSREQNERYYDSVKAKIEEILSTHPEDTELKRALNGGKFCKINYDEERYYLVGTIGENDEVKYLIYAVPGNYSYVPSELKPFTKFIPLSPFQPLGSGFYVIFQNADNGEIVTN